MNPPPSCPDRRDLQRLLLGRVIDHEAEQLEAHCASCPHCLEAMRALEGDDSLMSALRSSGRDTPLPPGVDVGGQLLQRLYGLGTLRPTSAAPGDDTALAAPPGYELLEKLGDGGMGVVYKARQHRPRRVVALKLLRFDPTRDAERRRRFLAEADLIARLDHPNIVRLFEVGETPAFLAMEYLAGGTLEQRLQRAPLPARDAARLAATLARALAAAHAGGVVHRDVKPANVLLVEDGTPKLADFGLAKSLDHDGSRTRTGVVMGTPPYMAPEQTDGGKEVGPPADIYALGALLYECLTGRPPFRAATALETLEQVRSADPLSPRRLVPGLPRDLETICLKCLHKSPGRRYARATDLADDLDRFLTGEPIRARPVGRGERLLKWARRRPAFAALLGVSVVGLAVLVGGAVRYERQLRAERDRAEGHRQQAVGNYRAARETLQKMLDRLGDPRRARLPGLVELRREQQEDALAFLVQVAGQQGEDPEVRRDVALAHYIAGRLQKDLGRNDEAKANLERARDLWDALAAAEPRERDYRRQLANALNALGSMHGNTEEADRLHAQALALQEQLAREAPDAPEYRFQQAMSHKFLGALAQDRKQLPEADKHYRTAVALFEQLVKEQPHERHHRVHLAATEVNLSLLLQGQGPGHLDGARVFHDRALASLERFLGEDPLDLSSALGLAVLRVNWGYVLLAQQKPDEVVADMRRNVALLTPFLEREPTHAELRFRLLLTHGMWATVLEGQARHPEEVAHRRRVVELDDGKNEGHRVHLAWTLARAGDHVAAVAETETFKDVQNPIMFLHLAQTCTVAAAKAGADEKLPPAERAAKAEQYAATAVRFLVRLKEKRGALTWAKDRADLLSDEFLKPLHDRPDFHRVMGNAPDK